MNLLPPKIIDFHVHLFPDRVMDAIRTAFIRDYSWNVVYNFNHAGCINHLRKAGVEKIVYSNYAHRPDFAGGLNEWNLRVLDENPDLYCFAAYHPGDSDALKMAERTLSHPRVLGIKLQLLVQRFYPHDERLFPMYEMVMEKGKRMLFHVGTGPVGNEFVGLTHFRKLIKRYPGLLANIAHMGAFEYGGFMELLDEYPGLYLDTAFAFFKEFNGQGTFDLGAEILERNKTRILYGSDFPNLIMPRESEINALLDLGLSRDFYDHIFYKNGDNLIKGIIKRAV